MKSMLIQPGDNVAILSRSRLLVTSNDCETVMQRCLSAAEIMKVHVSFNNMPDGRLIIEVHPEHEVGV